MAPDASPFPLPGLDMAAVLFEQAADFVGVYDVAAGWFTRVNESGYRLLGYASAQAFYADPVRTLQTPTRPQTEWAALLAQVRRQGRHTLPMEVRRQTGITSWVDLKLHLFWHEGREQVLVQFNDAECLHRTEQQLAQSVRRFEAVFTHATIGIIVCDRPGAIVLANEKAHQLFGYPPDTLPAVRIEDLVPDAVRHHHERLRASFNAHPQVRTMGANRDLLARRHDGSVFPVEISLSYFHLDEELFVVAYIIDITFKKEAEQALLAERQRVEGLNAELERKVADRTTALLATLEQLEERRIELSQALAAEQELGELKSRFVSMASHEFRTPLTAVLTSASLIRKYPATGQQPQRERHLDRIQASVKHLSDILEEFLSVGKLEEGKQVAHPAAATLPALVAEAVAEVAGLRGPGQRIETDLDGVAAVWLDGSLLRKVLVNLLSNALKYSPPETRITVQAAIGAAGQLVLRVQDQGMGISEEDQQHLFGRFFRARNAANVPGTGLGLYIVARYVELLGGTIALHSTLEAGTTVTLTLPYENNTTD